jgi:endonuclease/exonuclease/phosphatase family metal-dependent hydrolase
VRTLIPTLDRILAAGLALWLAACSVPEPPERAPAGEPHPRTLRIATFNVQELSREKLDRVDDEGRGQDPQLKSAAEIVQRIRPDVLLLNEIDFDDERANARLFVERYLLVGQGGQEPIDYPYVFFEPSNTGVPIGLDLNNDGDADDPEDCYGFGAYPGQYAMALLSRLPIDAAGARTFRELLWRDMPGHRMPDGEDGKPAWYDAGEAAVLRLSSKSHWDVHVAVGGLTLHVLASHPTPGVFDGDEDRNGRRNFDEIRLWADYLSGGEAASYLVDDSGRAGGLAADARFVVLGDLNADPVNDPGPYGVTAIGQLLDHPRVQDPRPAGDGGLHEERAYEGRKETRTAYFGRADYVLPDAGFEVLGSEIFWPAPGDPLHRLVDGPESASDHHLVWVDLAVPAEP